MPDEDHVSVIVTKLIEAFYFLIVFMGGYRESQVHNAQSRANKRPKNTRSFCFIVSVLSSCPLL